MTFIGNLMSEPQLPIYKMVPQVSTNALALGWHANPAYSFNTSSVWQPEPFRFLVQQQVQEVVFLWAVRGLSSTPCPSTLSQSSAFLSRAHRSQTGPLGPTLIASSPLHPLTGSPLPVPGYPKAKSRVSRRLQSPVPSHHVPLGKPLNLSELCIHLCDGWVAMPTSYSSGYTICRHLCHCQPHCPPLLGWLSPLFPLQRKPHIPQIFTSSRVPQNFFPAWDWGPLSPPMASYACLPGQAQTAKEPAAHR